MRYAFFIGGFSGFVLVALVGFLSERPGELVIRDAAISCLVMAFLFRWFWSVVVKSFVEVVHQRRREAAESAKKEKVAGETSPPVVPASQP